MNRCWKIDFRIDKGGGKKFIFGQNNGSCAAGMGWGPVWVVLSSHGNLDVMLIVILMVVILMISVLIADANAYNINDFDDGNYDVVNVDYIDDHDVDFGIFADS